MAPAAHFALGNLVVGDGTTGEFSTGPSTSFEVQVIRVATSDTAICLASVHEHLSPSFEQVGGVAEGWRGLGPAADELVPLARGNVYLVYRIEGQTLRQVSTAAVDDNGLHALNPQCSMPRSSARWFAAYSVPRLESSCGGLCWEVDCKCFSGKLLGPWNMFFVAEQLRPAMLVGRWIRRRTVLNADR